MKTFLRMVLIFGFLFFAAAVRTAEADNFTDDFSGGINTDHWTVSAGAYTIDDTQGDIRMSKPSGPGAWGSVLFNHEVRGDFDISVDYRDAVLAGCQNQIQLNLVFGGQYVANRRENWCESRYSVWRDPGGTAGETGTSDSSGTLRVTRAGSTVTFYANGAQIHQQVFNNSPVTDLWLSLQNNGTNDAISVTFDNFSVTADSIDGICTPPPSGMVSWWGGDNNALDMVGGSDGTLVNGTTYAVGKVGQAFSFDGVDDYVSGNGAQLPLGNSARAITAWVMTDSVTNQSILHYGGSDGSSPPNNLHLFIGDDRKAYIGNGWGLGTIPGTSDVSDGQWHFIAGVYEGSGTNIARIYVDGVEEANGAITEPDTATGSFEIGRFLNGTGGGQFSGLIDEVAIFNRALTADEIAAIYNAGSAGKCAPSIQHTLTVDGAGNGSGAVSATGIDCTITNGVSSGDCSEAYDEDTQVSLSPLADADSVFAGWSGDCDGNGDVTMDADKICTAAFALKTYTVTATVSCGDGTANPPSQTVNHYSTALVTAEADANYHVASMTGCGINYSNTSNDVISYTGTTAAVTADCTVTAVFVINQYTVTANATGDGTGNIQSNPGGINYNYPANNAGTTVPINHGTNVVLTATADTGSTAAWTTCSGTVAGNGTAAATCTYSSLDSDKTAEATFTAWPDLIVSSLAAGVRTYGTPLVRGVFANYMVMNQGSGDAVSSCLDFYLSRDAVIDPGDVYLGRENIPGLAAGNSYGSFKGFRLSSDKWQPASGTWRVIADADACGDNAESDETNNQTSTVAGIAAK